LQGKNNNRSCGKPLFVDDFFQHHLRLFNSFRASTPTTYHPIFLDNYRPFPSLKKWRPVDVPRQRIKRETINHFDT